MAQPLFYKVIGGRGGAFSSLCLPVGGRDRTNAEGSDLAVEGLGLSF